MKRNILSLIEIMIIAYQKLAMDDDTGYRQIFYNIIDLILTSINVFLNVFVAALIFSTIADWLTKHKNRNSPLGDLASGWGFSDVDERWPLYSTLDDCRDYLRSKNPPRGAMKTLESAWKSYQNYLKRKKSPISVKTAKRSTKSTNDPRQIEFVKNVKSLH